MTVCDNRGGLKVVTNSKTYFMDFPFGNYHYESYNRRNRNAGLLSVARLCMSFLFRTLLCTLALC